MLFVFVHVAVLPYQPCKAYGESMVRKARRIRKQSLEGGRAGWALQRLILKSNDDVRQEVFVMQVRREYCTEICLVGTLTCSEMPGTLVDPPLPGLGVGVRDLVSSGHATLVVVGTLLFHPSLAP